MYVFLSLKSTNSLYTQYLLADPDYEYCITDHIYSIRLVSDSGMETMFRVIFDWYIVLAVKSF